MRTARSPSRISSTGHIARQGSTLCSCGTTGQAGAHKVLPYYQNRFQVKEALNDETERSTGWGRRPLGFGSDWMG